MTEQTQSLTIDNTEYKVEDLSDKAKILCQHCLDIDQQIAQLSFKLDQANVSKKAFMEMLVAELPETVDEQANS